MTIQDDRRCTLFTLSGRVVAGEPSAPRSPAELSEARRVRAGDAGVRYPEEPKAADRPVDASRE